MKKLLYLLLSLIPFTVSANHSCVGKVHNIDVDGSGGVQTSIESVGGGNRLCSLKVKIGDFEPEACQAILSLLMSAHMSDRKIRLYFGNDTNTSCAKGNWQTLTDPTHRLYYVRLEK